MELGVATFADLSSGVSPEERMRQLLEEAELADQLGLDVFAVGEHHRRDFLVSSPAVALAAIAARTERIRLSSAVTVLSSDDPVRVFQQFAHVDLISGGRAEIMAGRGSFIESFPLFGYDLDDYDELFAEKLDLLLAIRDSENLTWSGRHRAPLQDAVVWPRPVQERLPIWVAVGGTPQSVVRAGALGLPLNRIGRERGWPPSARPEYDALRSPRGALAVGSPEQVAEKILFEHELFGNQRYIGQMSLGAVAHNDVLRSMELFGTEVAPVVRAEVARREAPVQLG
jgi:alkanesulfonate monooxygenase SsuD/methylene tetrahydromethanopterin reductase-like flavin-dependent oxidoreductase (luciferase family)